MGTEIILLIISIIGALIGTLALGVKIGKYINQ